MVVWGRKYTLPFGICTIVFLVLAAAGLQGRHDRTKVMLEHRDIAFLRAAPFRQGVRKKAVADLQPGFL